MNRHISFALLLAFPLLARAEIYSPPNNVKDPFKPATDRRQVDSSLPFLYLEPHDVCFDAAKPIPVTIYAVNRSAAAIRLDWRAIVESLTLDPVGPGSVTVGGRLPFDPVNLKPNDFAKITLDLRERFAPAGGSVYRLSYARPLDDGRLHVAGAAQFVVEDFAAVDKLAAALEAGAGRNTVTELLKRNAFFAFGGTPKTYGWDVETWHNRPEMLATRWDEPLRAADKLWREGLVRLTDGGGHPRAAMALLDRLLALSDNFRGTPGLSLREWFDHNVETGLDATVRERFHLKMAATRDPSTVARAVNRLTGIRSNAARDALIRVADGPDSHLAADAISCLSSFRRDAQITQFLRRKMTDPDPNLALEAAIASCYAGDSSGFPLLLRAARSGTGALRLKAIAQLGDTIFRPYRDKVVPVLLDELKGPTSPEHLEQALESLATYPTRKVQDAVKPFMTHANPQVSERARQSVAAIERDLKRD